MIGRSLAQYRITAAIGAGGMGEVYHPDVRAVLRRLWPKEFPEA